MQYKYRTIKIPAQGFGPDQKRLAKALNKWGKRGWELESVGKTVWYRNTLDVILRKPVVWEDEGLEWSRKLEESLALGERFARKLLNHPQ